jgi:hypothetical protein
MKEARIGGIGFLLNGNLLVAPEGVERDDQLQNWIQRTVKFAGTWLVK